jgi:hypothetical protein
MPAAIGRSSGLQAGEGRRPVRSSVEAVARVLRPRGMLVVPSLLALVPAFWVVRAAVRATYGAFGRDQGIFQYVAWALQHGDRDYSDLREINGPLIHLIHIVFQWVGGTDEHIFRVLDFSITGVVFFTVGALLAQALGRGALGGRGRWTVLLAWGGASIAILGSHYLLFGWWDQSQRESFYNLFILLSTALQIRAQSETNERSTTRDGLLLVAGALSAATWFGKPTCVLYTAGQALSLLLDKDLGRARRRGLLFLVGGTIVGSVPFLLFLLLKGDATAFVRIVFGETPRLYRYIWHKSPLECYRAWNNAPKLHYAFATLPLAALLVQRRFLPLRCLPLLSFLAVGLLTFFGQGKGFPYHLHPVSGAVHLIWLATAIAVTERWRRDGGRLLGAAVASTALVLPYQCIEESSRSPSMKEPWYAVVQSRGRGDREYWRWFTGGDYFALDLIDAASFLRETTREDDRVQTFGMDPYLLFLARRRSATPFIYSFELELQAAIEGAEAMGVSESEIVWLKSTGAAHVAELTTRLKESSPAAVALIDKAPFSFPEDADEMFLQHCPEAALFVRANYRLAKRFGVVRIWLRNDVHERWSNGG